MYFIQSGWFRVELELPDGKTLRLKKMGPGAVFGEMGLYTDSVRSASVTAAESGVVYRLSKKRIALIETRLPRLKSSIDRYLVNLLAGRVADANAMARDLMR
jgi:SulP family sulfate permease